MTRLNHISNNSHLMGGTWNGSAIQGSDALIGSTNHRCGEEDIYSVNEPKQFVDSDYNNKTGKYMC